MYEIVKKYYNMGLYDNSNLDLFESIGWITTEQKLDLEKNRA